MIIYTIQLAMTIYAFCWSIKYSVANIYQQSIFSITYGLAVFLVIGIGLIIAISYQLYRIKWIWKKLKKQRKSE
jgi:hypothetical protein